MATTEQEKKATVEAAKAEQQLKQEKKADGAEKARSDQASRAGTSGGQQSSGS